MALSLRTSARVGVSSARPARVTRVVRVYSAPDPSKVAAAIKEAEETCKDGKAADCAVAWDQVEELSAAAAHAKAAGPEDPLEAFCKDAPDADECRVYED